MSKGMSSSCPCNDSSKNLPASRNEIVLYGHFQRKSDKAIVQRFKCKRCLRTFSEASSDRAFGQKKRHLNVEIYKLLVSGNSQRRIALIKEINRKTVVRKFIYLGTWAEFFLPKLNLLFKKAKSVQFDDLITFEHVWTHPGDARINLKIQTKKSRDAAMYPASFWSYAPGPDGLRAL